MKKAMFLLLALLLLGAAAAASAEVTISFTPENPRMGDYVDVTVTSDREGAQTAVWVLSTPTEKVFSGETEARTSASFRPRKEADYTLSVTLSWGKKDTETASVTIPVSGEAPVQQGEDVIYSQRDGWWASKPYSKAHKRSVQKSGCALFALSHALQRMGISGDDVLPDVLAAANSRFYIEGRGTNNEGLINSAAEKFGFITQAEVLSGPEEIAACLRHGDYLSVGIVLGHIALADGVSEDGTKVHIVDSAFSATLERKDKFKTKPHFYYQNEDGSFTEPETPEQLPGLRWFFETGEYGGTEYWISMDYFANRDSRLIRPKWMNLETAEGSVPVTLDYIGTVWSRIVLNGEKVRVRTSELSWLHDEKTGAKIAVVSKKNTAFTDAAGNSISGIKALQPGAMVPVLWETDKLLYVHYRETFGYIKKANASLLDVSQDDFPAGIVSVNGKTTGSAKVNIRLEASAKAKTHYEWVAGTPLTLLEEKGKFWFAEGKGIRGWIQKEYVAEDRPDTPAE